MDTVLKENIRVATLSPTEIYTKAVVVADLSKEYKNRSFITNINFCVEK